MRSLLRKATVALVGLCVAAWIAVWSLYRASQQEPEFYAAVLRDASFNREQAGDALEKGMLDLHNEAREAGRWEALFTDEQLNGWLATDLIDKFPDLLPRGAKDPRVAIAPKHAQIACRYERGKVETVISFALHVDLTDKTNTLAIRVSKLRAGALPVPLGRFLDGISQASRQADIPLRWTSLDGQPLALVTVPVQHEDYAHREIYLENIELRQGAIYLAGRTKRTEGELLAQRTSSSENEMVHR